MQYLGITLKSEVNVCAFVSEDMNHCSGASKQLLCSLITVYLVFWLKYLVGQI